MGARKPIAALLLLASSPSFDAGTAAAQAQALGVLPAPPADFRGYSPAFEAQIRERALRLLAQERR